MYVDLACLGKTTTEEQTREAVFAASACHLNGVCILSAYVGQMREFVPDMILSCPIDYPQGTSDIKVRNHAVLAALRKGANAIDLVLNHPLAMNHKMEQLIDDIESNLSICRDNNASLRIMMEYRMFEDAALFFDISNLLKESGVEYVFPATGHRMDNYRDNLICAKVTFEKSGLQVICNGNIVSKDQYEEIKRTNIFGIRFTSIPVIKQIFGV